MNINYNNINDDFNNLKVNWKIDPFPHAIIDNFLQKDVFANILKCFEQGIELKDVHKKFNTDLELNKEVYGDKDLKDLMKLPIEVLGGEIIKNTLQGFVGNIDLISLCDCKNYGGYYPFHTMTKGGLLGSHVDHSKSKYGDIHVANSIYYVSPEWEESWGGETILFDKNGYNIKTSIQPKPNRLVLFIHSSTSFHGVNTITNLAKFKRSTYYMDYYINDKDLKNLQINLKNQNYFESKYTNHPTTFIPLFPLGKKSFNPKTLFKPKTYYPYLYNYMKYLFNRFSKQ